MEIIRSKDNKKIKEARKLLTRKGRKQSGHYLIEGFHLLEEAVKFDAALIQIFISEDKQDKVPSNLTQDLETEKVVVSEEVLKSLSDADSPQGVVAELAQIPVRLDFSQLKKVLILENVQDPGNVGTMVRTADAAGYDAVLAAGETADIYSPKVLRAMQGSHFHLPVAAWRDLPSLFESLKRAGLPLLTTTLSSQSVPYQIVQEPAFALLMGNEGAGASEAAVQAASQLVHIDMPGQAESLNVAVAAGILMFSL